MKTQILKKLLAFTIILIVFSSCAPALIDISPDRNNGIVDGGNQSLGAGLILTHIAALFPSNVKKPHYFC